MSNDIKLIVFDNCKKLGEKVSKIINEDSNDIIVPISTPRFSNGESRGKIMSTIRDKDLYILSDVGNYSITYKMHEHKNHMSPDEHFQDIKRVILAASGHARKITVIMPLLYQARQHRKQSRESLDCANALQELERLNVDEIITFDAHDPNVVNAIPTTPFDNFFATHTILSEFINNEPNSINNILVVSPDMGAMERARYCAEMIGCDVGLFYKRRDLSKIVNGKNPIVEHIYLGTDVKGKDIIVIDDMISSGSSILEVATSLKEKGANKIFFMTTFSLFTEGHKTFDEAYNNNIFNKVYSTNLTYVPNEILNKEWFQEVDCSNQIAQIITTLNNKESIAPLFNGKDKILSKIKALKKD